MHTSRLFPYLLAALFLPLNLAAQESTATLNALRLPTSSHAAALGGENISVIEDTPWAGYTNPALYANTADRSLALNFTTLPASGSWMGAAFVRAFGERHTAAVTAQYLSYGKVTETDETEAEYGEFTPKDIVLGGAYSYLLSERWTGGAALRSIYAKYAEYTSWALAVDLGLNYFDDETDLSLSLALRNIGAQVKHFDNRTQRIPFCATLGVTKGMAHLPIRLSLTLTDLTRWKTTDFYVAEGESLNFSDKLLRHVCLGLDVLPSAATYLSAGYNFRRGAELKAAGSSHGAGLTLGGGLLLERFRLGVSYAKYHVAAGSLQFNVAYTL